MHRIILYTPHNLMDARNLAIVLAPNLVKSTGPESLHMFFVPPTSSDPSFSTPSSVPNISHPSPTTLGSLLRLCIERYYEIFEELSSNDAEPPLPATPLSQKSFNTGDSGEDEGEELLIMPIGPTPSYSATSNLSPNNGKAKSTRTGASSLHSTTRGAGRNMYNVDKLPPPPPIPPAFSSNGACVNWAGTSVM